MKSDPYFQFPLCALAYGSNYRIRLETIIAYSVVHAGRVHWERLTPKEQAERRERVAKCPRDRLLKSFDPCNDQHLWVLLGAIVLRTPPESFPGFLEQYERLHAFHQEFVARHGGDPFVRLRTDIVRDVLHPEKRLTYHDLAVFAGLMSAVGERRYAVVSREMIQSRAQGYKSEAVHRAEWRAGERPDKDDLPPLTPKRVRCALERLHQRGFFVKVNPSRRTACYSLRMSREELVAELKKDLAKRRPAVEEETALANAELRQARQAARVQRSLTAHA